MDDIERLLFRGTCINCWCGRVWLTCNLRDAAVGIADAQQAGETRRAKHEVAADSV